MGRALECLWEAAVAGEKASVGPTPCQAGERGSGASPDDTGVSTIKTRPV